MNKIIMQKVLIIIAVAVALITNSCKDNGTGPENLEPGRRDYVWTVDTVNVRYGFLTKLWGDSSDNLWIIGDVDGDENIWQYKDGEWETDHIYRNIQAWSIFGFGKNNVWVSGSAGNIWHFNGTGWNLFTSMNYEEYEKINLLNMWGESSSNIYAVGDVKNNDSDYKGIILNFDGNNWKNIELPDLRIFFYDIRKDLQSNKYYIHGYTNDTGVSDTCKIFEFDGKTLKQIYSSTTWISLENIGKWLYVSSYDGNIYRIENSKLVLWKNIVDENFGLTIWGRNEKDIFIRMEDGIAHFNGYDIEYLYRFNDTNLSLGTAALFDDQVYFLCHDFSNNLNLVIKGSLKQ
jgi:hypothetical protein